MGQAAIDARAVGTGVWSLELDRYATTLSLLLQPPAACVAAHAVQAALPLEVTQLKTTVPQRRANHTSSPNLPLTLTLTLTLNLTLNLTPTLILTLTLTRCPTRRRPS